MGALISFLGSSIFRMIWGEASAAWTKHQDHKHEIEELPDDVIYEIDNHDGMESIASYRYPEDL